MDGFQHAWVLKGSAVGPNNCQFEIARSRRMKEVGRKLSAASPCAACKLLRRRCTQHCVFAPHFPANEPLKFANVHKVFGASNVSKLLQEIPAQQRGDAVSSLVYEANARMRDPVYGCVGAISSLHRQIQTLQAQLAVVQAQMVHLHMKHAADLAHHATSTGSSSPLSTSKNSQLMEADPVSSKSVFTLDMVVLEHAHLVEPPIWSF